jgi:RNA polymerase sigma-70 factor (ECF subfamily)
VNSSLQRARATLDASDVRAEAAAPLDEEQQSLLQRYVAAFEAYDMDALVSVLHEDATMSMPPYPLWLQGHVDIVRWHLEIGAGCRDSRLVPVAANGSGAWGQYKPGPDGSLVPWAIQLVEVSDGKIVGLNAFLDTERLFPLFGLPPRLDP